MKQFKVLATAFAAALLVAACGGGGNGDQTPAIHYSSMVSFGDSLSDVGTYAVGDVAKVGGGKYTVNGMTVDDNNTTASKNWTERIAAQLQLPAPCAAETGLAGKGFLPSTVLGFVTATAGAIAAVFHDGPTEGCYNYAQGGARVTDPRGPYNILNTDNAQSAALGQLTVPIVQQIQNHLGKVGSFKGDELVTVMAGGNDAIQLGDDLTAAAGQAGVVYMVGQLVTGVLTASYGVAPAAAGTAASTALGTVLDASTFGTSAATSTAAASAAAVGAALAVHTTTADVAINATYRIFSDVKAAKTAASSVLSFTPADDVNNAVLLAAGGAAVKLGNTNVLDFAGYINPAIATATAAATAAGNPAAFIPSMAGTFAADTPVSTAANPAIIAAMTAAAPAGTTAMVTAAVLTAAKYGNTKVLNAAYIGPLKTATLNTALQYGSDHGPELVAAMGKAGAELAGYVKSRILANGAKYVVVVNLPDISRTPSQADIPATATSAAVDNSVERLLGHAMSVTFNAQLAAGLANTPGVTLVDVYTENLNQINYPDHYALKDVTHTACDLTKILPQTSLICTKNTLINGDVSHYLFADKAHPTPYGYKLLAQYVAQKMIFARWL